MESIYNLLPLPPPYTLKHQRYQSIFRPLAEEEFKQHRLALCKTIGPAKTERPNPSHFLRSYACNNLQKKVQTSKQENLCPGKKPPLPNFSQIEHKNHRVTNFLSQNKLNTLLFETKKPEPIIIDTRDGHKFSLNGSGLTEHFVYKKDFGKTPKYIKFRKHEKQKNDTLYACYKSEAAIHQQIPRLSQQEREDLLKSLKERHAKVYKEYICLSVIIDTIHKKSKKRRLENELDDLERDIQTVEEHEIICVQE